jgi:phage gp29-like protein
MATPILAPDGVTPLRQMLTNEIAGPSLMTGRQVTSGNPSAGLTPERLAAILRGAEDGNVIDYLELAEAIEEKYLHYIGVLGTRKRQVSQLPITVVAASDDPLDQEKADLVREWLERDTLEAELFDMLDAIGKGYSLTEIVWNLSRAPWLPEKLIWRDPRWFEFDRLDGVTPLLRGAGSPQPLPPYKFVYHTHASKSGLPIRSGLARPVAWAWLFQSFSLKDWVSFAHVYGFPVRLGKYQPGASEEDIRTLLRAVANVSADAAAVIPSTMQMEFISAQAGSSAEVFQMLCEYLDKQVSKAVLGQTGTTDGESGRLGGGAGREHGDVRGDIERADAKLLATTLNRDIVRPIIDFNFGRPADGAARYPRIRIGREDDREEFSVWLDGVERFVDRGGRVEASVVRDRLGLPDPEPGATLLAAKAAGSPQEPAGAPAGPFPPETASTQLSRFLNPLIRPSDPAAAASAAAEPEAVADQPGRRDDIDALVDILADEGWEGEMEPMIGPLREALAAAGSYEQAVAALVPAMAAMDADRLAQRLERAAFAVRATALTGADGLLKSDGE